MVPAARGRSTHAATTGGHVRDFGIALLASLGVVAQLAVVGLLIAALAAAVSPAARRAIAPAAATLGEWGAWMAAGVAAVAVAGSLWFSNDAGFIPCHLCWLQREVMYPLAFLLVAVAIVRRWWLTLAAAVLPLIGAGISARHVWVEAHPDDESAACRVGVPCSVKWIDEFGYITIPVLAGTAFVLVALLLVASGLVQRRQGAPR